MLIELRAFVGILDRVQELAYSSRGPARAGLNRRLRSILNEWVDTLEQWVEEFETPE